MIPRGKDPTFMFWPGRPGRRRDGDDDGEDTGDDDEVDVGSEALACVLVGVLVGGLCAYVLVLEGLVPEGSTKISASSGFQCLRPPRADLASSALAKPADDRVEDADAVRESDVALLLAPPAGGSRTAPRSSRPARFAPPAHKPGRCLAHLVALSQ